MFTSPLAFGQSSMVFEGTVLDFETGLPLPEVVVVAGNKHILSDAKGGFSVEVSTFVTEIKLSRIAYASLVIFPHKEKNKQVFYLKPISRQMEEVQIYGDDGNKSTLTPIVGLQSLDKKDIAKAVGFMGQADPLKAMSALPGVGNGGEGNAGLYIRGGSSGQNLTLLNEAVIYNPTHLLGLFSVFNPQVVDQLNLYKNGSTPVHQGRISGTVELKTAKSVKDSLKVMVDISIFSLNLDAEVPIKKNWSIGVYSRKTFLNQTVWPIMEKLGRSSFFKKVAYDFYDFNLISNSKLAKNTNLQISFYKGGDDFGFRVKKVNVENTMDWTNTAASATLTNLIANKALLTTTVSWSAYAFNFGINQNNYQAGVSSAIKDFNVKHFVSLYSKNHELKVGFQFIKHQFKPNTPYSQSFDTPFTYEKSNTYYTNELAAFFTDEYHLSDKLTLNSGVRLNTFLNKGPYQKTNEDGSKTSYVRGETMKTLFFLAPSVAANYRLSNTSALKAGLSYTVQPIHLASVTAVNFPADFWIPAINNIKPATAWQGSVGYFKDFTDKKYNFFIELYYKEMQKLVEFSGGIVSLLDNLQIEDNLWVGKGQSYGLETFVKKNSGKLTGSISYTLAYSNRQFPQINEGKTYPFKYDRRHNLSIISSYQTNGKWNLSAGFSLASGSAFTMPVSRYMIAGNIVNEYGTFNGSRMPLFHRLDIAAARQLKSTQRFSSSIVFSIYNLYSRQNPIYSFFLAEGDLKSQRVSVSQKEIALLPILPAINYRIKFK